MLPALVTAKRPEPRLDTLRAAVHDLRNLFAVVSSAKSLLDRPLDERTKAIVADALCRVASDGKVLTDELLSGGLEDHQGSTNASHELRDLASILETFEGPGLKIELSIDQEASWILMPASELRAVVLELVTNASKAGAHAIRIRAARRGGRYWLIVADDGRGFDNSREWTDSSSLTGLHGTGLRRLASAVALAGGKVRIKSRRLHGTAIALILPLESSPWPSCSLSPRPLGSGSTP